MDYSQPDLFTNHEGLVVDLNELRRDVCQRCTDIGRPLKDGIVRNGTLWWWIVDSHWGTRNPSGMDSVQMLWSAPHLESPWADRLKALKPATDRPRVLVTGTNSQMRMLNNDPSKTEAIAEILKKRDIEAPTWSINSSAGYFWDHFVGLNESEHDFIEEAHDRPTLILTTGSMRSYGPCGGETFPCLESLQRHAAFWDIPVEPLRL